MIRNTIRRVYCNMVILDHDVDKASGVSSLFNTSVLDIRINYQALLNDQVSPFRSSELITLHRWMSKARILLSCWSNLYGYLKYVVTFL